MCSLLLLWAVGITSCCYGDCQQACHVHGTDQFSECPSGDQSQSERPHAVVSTSGYANSRVLQPAAKHTTLIRSSDAPEKRVAKNGVAYTLEGFGEYYDVHGTDQFSECPRGDLSQSEQPHAVVSSSGYANSCVLQPVAE